MIKTLKADAFFATALQICLALICAVNCAIADDASSRAASEYQLKAAFLLNFGKFTEWPPAALAASPDIHICVLGKDPFGPDLDKVVTNQMIHDKPVKIIRLSSPQGLRDCQILYLSATEEPRFKRILGEIQRGRTLTVSDSPRFLESGGMIQLLIENERVVFSVNLRSAEAAGLKISSKLLQIAKTVKVQT